MEVTKIRLVAEYDFDDIAFQIRMLSKSTLISLVKKINTQEDDEEFTMELYEYFEKAKTDFDEY